MKNIFKQLWKIRLEHSVNDELYEDEFEDYDLDDDMQMRF